MTLTIAKLLWLAGCVGWWVIRYPHERRSRRSAVARRVDRAREVVLLTISFCGLFVIPLIYAATNRPTFANYPLNLLFTALGAAVFAAALILFYRVHRELGRSWSVTLELRDQHALVTDGLYAYVRHPMYSAFWLWALAQALLLPNWVAGFSGLVGFGVLYFARIGHEEQMMLDAFGEEYRAYSARTKRIIPGVY